MRLVRTAEGRARESRFPNLQGRENRHAQAGVEFLAVTGIGMLLIIGISVFLLSDSKSTRDQESLAQTYQIGTTIVEEAHRVAALGKNSWISVDAQVPTNVQGIYTVENKSLVFVLGTSRGRVEQAVFSDVPIAGTIASGNVLNVTANGRTSGTMTFRVFSNGSVILLTVP